MQVWVVGIEVGRLNQLLGPLALSDKKWCCDRCRLAALAANQATSNRHGSHYAQAEHQQDSPIRATPPLIDRRG